MFHESWAQEQRQQQEPQRVEHENWICIVPVTLRGRHAYTCIDGKRYKVYPTGNEKEPWTTNISLMR